MLLIASQYGSGFLPTFSAVLPLDCKRVSSGLMRHLTLHHFLFFFHIFFFTLQELNTSQKVDLAKIT